MFRLTQIALSMQDTARAVEGGRRRDPEPRRVYPGEPLVFCHDLEGHEIELWQELSTAADPRAPSHGA
jgi:hypothetical protein